LIELKNAMLMKKKKYRVRWRTIKDGDAHINGKTDSLPIS
jgi:hypothetical protein